ncbi:MAG: hypothetical protein OEW67_01050 [Cyclobacteriaceae bacterium]|nr:hypothetical protein [Cyclobacteriaceae bacterium]
MLEKQLTEKDVEAMKKNVSLLEDEIIHFKEYPTQNIFSVNFCFDEITKLAAPYNHFYLIIDLTEAGRPNVLTRKEIKKRFHLIKSSIKHTAFYTGKNILITAAIRFVMYQIGLESYSVHTSKKDAISQIYLKREKMKRNRL